MKNSILLFLLLTASLLSFGQNGRVISNKLDTVVMYQDSIFEYRVRITGGWEFQVKYRLILNSGAEIDSLWGYFTFEANEDFEEEKKYYDFIVEAKNVFYCDRDTFTIVVYKRQNEFPVIKTEIDSVYNVDAGSIFQLDLEIYDPEGGPLSVGIEDFGNIKEAQIFQSADNDTVYRLEAQTHLDGPAYVIISYSDGHHTFTKEINLQVYEGENQFPVFNTHIDSVYYLRAGDTLRLDIEIFDPDGLPTTAEITGYDDNISLVDIRPSGNNMFHFEVAAYGEGYSYAIISYSDGYHVLTKKIKLRTWLTYQFPIFSPDVDSVYYIEVGTEFELTITITDPENKHVYLYAGDSYTPCGFSMGRGPGEPTWDFTLHSCEPGSYYVIFIYLNDYHTMTKRLNFEVGYWSDANDIEKPDTELLVYPNPAQDIVNFEFILENGGMVDIDIYNLSGQLVQKAVSEYFEAGKNNVTTNSSNLIPGTYLCLLRKDGELLETVKILKQ